jgi:hypothetical protein
MTQLEERLRRGMKRYSERIRPEAIRPLQEPSGARRSRAVRWLAPATAAVAVIGVIVGVSLSGQRAQRPSASQLRPTGESVLKGMPRYYVTVFQTYAGRNNPIEEAVVHDSATGAALSSVHVPLMEVQGGFDGPGITAAANDRTFVVFETGTKSFFLLRVAADGRSVTRSRLRIGVRAPYENNAVALSPDGRQLAMQVQYCPHGGSCATTGIWIVTIATGVTRTWTTQKPGAAFDVSWAGNDQVAFRWQGQSQPGYRLLSVTGPGGNLLASTPIASPQPEPTEYTPTALVTANGRTVFTTNIKNIPDGHGTDTVVAKVIELDAQTGKLLRVLRTVTMHGVSTNPDSANSAGSLDQSCNVRSLAPSGVHLLVACYAFGRLDGSVFTPLPGFPSPSHGGVSQQTTGAW